MDDFVDFAFWDDSDILHFEMIPSFFCKKMSLPFIIPFSIPFEKHSTFNRTFDVKFFSFRQIFNTTYLSSDKDHRTENATWLSYYFKAWFSIFANYREMHNHSKTSKSIETKSFCQKSIQNLCSSFVWLTTCFLSS